MSRNALFKKCKEDKFSDAPLKWIMHHKETEINKILPPTTVDTQVEVVEEGKLNNTEDHQGEAANQEWREGMVVQEANKENQDIKACHNHHKTNFHNLMETQIWWIKVMEEMLGTWEWANQIWELLLLAWTINIMAAWVTQWVKVNTDKITTKEADMADIRWVHKVWETSSTGISTKITNIINQIFKDNQVVIVTTVTNKIQCISRIKCQIKCNKWTSLKEIKLAECQAQCCKIVLLSFLSMVINWTATRARILVSPINLAFKRIVKV